MTANSGFPDFRPAGNVAVSPVLYDIENRAMDPDGLMLDAIRSIAPWAGRTLLDLGCGTGYWLDGYATVAGDVIGVEPDPELVELARNRTRHARVLAGSAEHLPMPDESVDVVHARFAYFFPPGCEAGLAEVFRVLRPNGCLVVVDNDHRHGEFATLLSRSAPAAAQGHADITDEWWLSRGAVRAEVMSEWRFDSRSDFEAVLRMEFPREVADQWLDMHAMATGLSYGYALFAIGPYPTRDGGE
jgi:ubiquinone/menaquinone biosynthesis C-methylase UbiE